jgi:octaprenyl-diphosphate synthase
MAASTPEAPAPLGTSSGPLRLETIRQPIAAELDHFERYFRSALKSPVALLDRVMHYIIRRKGKQMRPMFVLLAARLCGGIRPESYRAAALIELLHTATLVHDDVVDDSDQRRGFFSLNALWKNKIAVLVGDYLLSRGLLMSLEHDDFQLLKITSQAVKLMSEGELLQLEKARKLNIDEPLYFEIIRKKTASLIASCTECGAASAGAEVETIERMRRFGEAVGMAFQIKDDLFDYGYGQAGKPMGIDLQEKKMTLPLIYTLNRASWAERRRLINVVKRYNTDRKQVAWLMDQVHQSGGIAYAEATMRQYIAQAEAELAYFAPSDARQSLADLVSYTIARSK